MVLECDLNVACNIGVECIDTLVELDKLFFGLVFDVLVE